MCQFHDILYIIGLLNFSISHQKGICSYSFKVLCEMFKDFSVLRHDPKLRYLVKSAYKMDTRKTDYSNIGSKFLLSFMISDVKSSNTDV